MPIGTFLGTLCLQASSSDLFGAASTCAQQEGSHVYGILTTYGSSKLKSNSQHHRRDINLRLQIKVNYILVDLSMALFRITNLKGSHTNSYAH